MALVIFWRAERALEVRELDSDVVRTLLELRVLIHGHLVHGAEPVNLAAKRRNLALTGLAVLGLGHLEGLLEHMATVRGDGGNRLLHAHLELSGLDLEATLLGLGPLELGGDVGHLLAGVADRLLEGVRVCLGQARAVAQALGPRERTGMDRLVALVERVDAQAKHLERARALLRGTGALGELVDAARELAVALVKVSEALARRRQREAGVCGLLGGIVLGTGRLATALACLLDETPKLGETLLALVDALLELLQARTGRLGALRRRLATRLHLGKLVLGMAHLRLQAPELGVDGVALAPEPRDGSGGLACSLARLGELLGRRIDESCRLRHTLLKLGNAALECGDLLDELGDATLALERSRRGTGRCPRLRAAVGKRHDAVGRHVSKRGVFGVG